MVAVVEHTGPIQRWIHTHREHREGVAAPTGLDGVRIVRRKDRQLAACARLLGLVSAKSPYPLPRPATWLGWLNAEDVLDAWVADQHGRIQGHVAISRVDGDPARAMRWREVTGRPAAQLAEVSRLFVRPASRGRGLGTALLETAVTACRERALVPVGELVSTSRQGVPLFERAGWRMVAMYPSGKRGDDLETYLYAAPAAHA